MGFSLALSEFSTEYFGCKISQYFVKLVYHLIRLSEIQLNCFIRLGWYLRLRRLILGGCKLSIVNICDRFSYSHFYYPIFLLCDCKGCTKISQDLDQIENAVFSILIIIFDWIIKYKMLFIEYHIGQMISTTLLAHTHSFLQVFHGHFA